MTEILPVALIALIVRADKELKKVGRKNSNFLLMKEVNIIMLKIAVYE
jgi:hypothetical protein